MGSLAARRAELVEELETDCRIPSLISATLAFPGFRQVLRGSPRVMRRAASRRSTQLETHSSV